MNKSMKKYASIFFLAFLTHNTLVVANADEKNSPAKKADSALLVAAKSVGTCITGLITLNSLIYSLDILKDACDSKSKSKSKYDIDISDVDDLKNHIIPAIGTNIALSYITYRFAKSTYKSYKSRFGFTNNTNKN